MRSLCLRSDLMVSGTGHILQERADRYVLRTPDQPDYWFGNTVIFKSYRDDPAALISQFKQDFPDASHVCLQWDVPNLPRGDGFDAYLRQGFSIEEIDTLVLDGDVTRFDLPGGITARALHSDDDWAQLVQLQIDTGLAGGYSKDDHPPYVTRSFEVHRRACHAGRGAWFGAFDGDLLVADMGIYLGDGLARYQSVETRSSHRRMGLCRALVGMAHDWARARDPRARLVIVADRDRAPGRIYRACGFTPVETMISVVKGSY